MRRNPLAKWQDEAPTRPHAKSVSASGVRTAPPPLALGKARAVLAFENERSAADDEPSGIRRSTIPPPPMPPNEFEQWFESTAAPAQADVTAEPRVERRSPPRTGIVAVTAAVAICTMILAGAVVARATAALRGSDAANAPTAPTPPTAATDPPGPPAAVSAAAPVPVTVPAPVAVPTAAPSTKAPVHPPSQRGRTWRVKGK